MVEITKIERVSKARALYHLYAQDTLMLTISEETLLHFSVSKGKRLDETQLAEMQRFDQVQRCIHQALRYLSRRGHFVQELERKLLHRGFEPAIISQAIAYLQEKQYLNDAQLCEAFIQDGIKLKKYGPLLLRKKLRERGVSAQTIEEQLEQAYPQALQEETAGALAKKKIKSLVASHTPPPKIRQKLSAFLLQRGFPWPVIQSILSHLPTEQPEEE